MNATNLKKRLALEYQVYKEFYRKYIFSVLILGLMTAAVFFLASFYFKDFIVQQTNSIAEQMINGSMEEPTSLQKLFSIFFNNLLVGAIIILIGFIPVYGLPFLLGLFSFASVGILAGYGIIMKHNVLHTLAIAFVPHAVIEIIPILYSIAIGMYINRNMVKKVLFRKKKSEKAGKMATQGFTSFTMIIIPLFLLAALVEAFITARLVEIFL
ncbi:stage II sporulation protein M [Cytobacillus firmus]|jgi:stage II sporulation protein M|uniref:stage II sporulation protein M n=1 Tax=Cytobacillus firmus TaxID=1399 RepID=UPI00207A1F0D|nr:stage II sporulation protein M [Cytobacillus firmus]USK37198.1 stage II sporulation protein M [Cytobacillus firmus]